MSPRHPRFSDLASEPRKGLAQLLVVAWALGSRVLLADDCPLGPSLVVKADALLEETDPELLQGTDGPLLRRLNAPAMPGRRRPAHRPPPDPVAAG
jgi:hypothetical protein